MIRKFLLPLLSIAGVAFAMVMVIRGNKPVPAAPPVAQPAQAPFAAYVAGAGIVEARTENISIGTDIPGLCTDVLVQVGDAVKQDQPLFKITDRALNAELAVRKAALATAQAKLKRLQSMPRPEEIPPAEAKVKEAEANLARSRELWQQVEKSIEDQVFSREEVARRRFAFQADQAKLSQAQADLALLKAGSWKEDVAMAQAEVENARAMVQQTETEIGRLTVAAPVDGDVLQVKIRPGEYAGNDRRDPLVLLGNINLLHIRCDVDENDAWKVSPSAKGRAFVRGNPDLWTDLKFVRIEPFIVPKRSLTGDSAERVDTRVLQVLYSFDRRLLPKPVYVGQQMDVFIERPDVATQPATTSTAHSSS